MDTLLRPLMTDSRLFMYLRVITIFFAMPSPSNATAETYPSSRSISAICTFILEEGTSTVSLFAIMAFLMRVSISAIGSVIASPSLPACLSHAGNLALVAELTEADSAHSVLAEHCMRPSAAGAPCVRACGILGGSLLFHYHCFLSHASPHFLKGIPRSLKSSLASSSVCAVVTMFMSIPLTFSTWSYTISGKMSCSLRPMA